MRTIKGGGLYCFSPPVMLATFALEICLAVYTLWRYKLNYITRLVALVLVMLAAFQLSEYMVCTGGLGMSSEAWARIGYAAISTLPPLGLHLAHAIAGRSNYLLVGMSYLVAEGFVSYFLFVSDVFSGSQCLGNYVIFQLGSVASALYTIYYYGLLLLTIGVSISLAAKAKPKNKRALQLFAAGYLLFMLPTTIANTIDPNTISGIPSIMCGFAVIMALVVVSLVAPLATRRGSGKK